MSIRIFLLLIFGGIFLMLSCKKEGAGHYETIGGHYNDIELDDGSMVHMNVWSKFTWPYTFSDSVREVKLIGGGYFEVTDDARPFILDAPYCQVKANNAAFNINAYNHQEFINLSVAKGQIEITFMKKDSTEPFETLILEANKKVVYTKGKDDWEFTEENIENDLLWKDKIMVFKNTRYEQIFWELEKRYNMHFIVYNTPVLDARYTGRFENVHFSDILDTLRKHEFFGYREENRNIYITD